MNVAFIQSLRAAAAGLVFMASMPAYAVDGLSGSTWVGEDGGSRIKFSACGSSLCGYIVWLKDTTGKTKVGDRVFYDLKVVTPTHWDGQAFDPDSGNTYKGAIDIQGDKLVTKGCALAGLICQSIEWKRVS